MNPYFRIFLRFLALILLLAAGIRADQPAQFWHSIALVIGAAAMVVWGSL